MALAPIELLPPELIQPIFFLSGANLALVDASHHIAAKLSVDYVYHEICVHYLTQNLFSRAEQSSAQSRIFRTKWMTWTFFKSFVLKTYGPKGCLCGQTPEEGCFDAQWPPNFANATTMLFTRSHLPKLSFVKCRLPFRLLHGPWTKDKIEFLRFLLWTTSMTVDWSDSFVRKKAGEGKKDAIIERNLEAVEIFNHNRRLGKAPGMSTVRFAVMEAGCDRSIVFDIMATARAWGLRGESWNCSELDEWCEKGIREGNPKARWLQIKLKELRTTYSTGYLIRDNGAGNSNSLFGYMDAKSGDYDGGPDDKLVINRHQWNEEVRMYGYWTRGPGMEPRGLHHVGTLEMGDPITNIDFYASELRLRINMEAWDFDWMGRSIRFWVYMVLPVSDEYLLRRGAMFSTLIH